MRLLFTVLLIILLIGCSADVAEQPTDTNEQEDQPADDSPDTQADVQPADVQPEDEVEELDEEIEMLDDVDLGLDSFDDW